MTEIPEHLRKRAEEARAKAAAASGASPAEPAAPAAPSEPSAAADTPPADPGESRIPAHLLERSKAARGKADGAPTEVAVPAENASAGVNQRVSARSSS